MHELKGFGDHRTPTDKCILTEPTTYDGAAHPQVTVPSRSFHELCMYVTP